MRIAHLLRASLVVGCAACSGKAAPTGPAAPATTERPPGTSGFPGLDWGANVDDVKTLYPTAEPDGGGFAWKGDVEGSPAHIQFVMDGDGLQQIEIAWDADFASMEECGDTLHRTRPPIDLRLGKGPEENLGVFWETATASVVLACNPTDDDSGHGKLTSTYQRKAPVE